ncbi:TrbG/VirB9 family P-type conjugative transfer protein [Fusobacterium ulcerans]|uniref:TrbG/VirB9 family P-type conjugative transfer protein n=1 Tax=Fusobacterium ulcerans TaxID=861 RepID=UPI001D0AFDD8|nr:TrbG/VirB9 family P-type conjugative transfer protein [Fusobacterium ulcerans]MCB8566322.1 TrbG/VirB9 family P-type conjugative transfer protein [Fusobacterium ulcerans]MCB8650375.1 TrbG/VirB9 family P-type conjugative transfer protein [Fusobacterium ulcerans]
MKKKILIIFCLLSSLMIAADQTENINPDYNIEATEYIDFSMAEPEIRSGAKAARQNIGTTFVYSEKDMYRIYCREGFLTTIYFNPDEEITFMAGGDTERWTVEEGITGSKDGNRTIVTLKPFMTGIKTNLIINTNKRTYNFFLHAANDWYNPMVTFRYPQDIMLKNLKRKQQDAQLTPINLENLNYSYEWKKTKDPWCPMQVFDDGEKTFILLSKKADAYQLPVIFIRDEQTGKEAMVRGNYNPDTNYFIIDRLIDQIILQYGKKKIIIKKDGSFIKQPKDHYPVRL